MATKQTRIIGEETWKNNVTNPKVNAELFTLTYGTMVAKLCEATPQDYAEVNRQLDKMGYNIGMRLVEDFFAKTSSPIRCSDFRDTVEVVSKVAFKMYLNVTPVVTNWSSDGKQCSLILDENPLADFVQLPDDGRAENELWFSNVLCGVIRAALEMVAIEVTAEFKSDVLRGDEHTEMRLTYIEDIPDELPTDDG